MKIRSIVDRLHASIQLMRPGNLMILFVGVLVGAGLEGGSAIFLDDHAVVRSIIAALSVALVGAGSNVMNDYFDMGIDTVNRPDRPLVSGRLTKSTAASITFVTITGGIAFGFIVSLLHGTIAASTAIAMWWYNRMLKRKGIAGNLLIALVVGTVLVYGGLIVGDGRLAAIGAVFAFILTLAREIVKDIQDIAGDTADGSRSLPIVSGQRVATASATALILITILMTPFPFLLADFGGLFVLTMIAVNLILLGAVVNLRVPDCVGRSSSLLKAGMMFGLIGLILGRISG